MILSAKNKSVKTLIHFFIVIFIPTIHSASNAIYLNIVYMYTGFYKFKKFDNIIGKICIVGGLVWLIGGTVTDIYRLLSVYAIFLVSTESGIDFLFDRHICSWSYNMKNFHENFQTNFHVFHNYQPKIYMTMK